MPERAARLAEYCHDRLGKGLRAVGYHTDSEFELEYIREDLVDKYPPDRVEQFLTSSRAIHGDLKTFDEQMGTPEASLHLLQEGLIVQFHFPGEDVVFLSMDRDIGRDFTTFIRACLDEMR